MDSRPLPSDPIPPHNPEAERAVLGAMLLDADAASAAIESLKPDDYYRDAHKKIFRALCTLYDQNVVPDELVLREELARTGDLDKAGGLEYLRELSRGVTSAALVEDHVKLVRDSSTLRGLIDAASEALRSCYQPGQPIDHILDEAEKGILKVSESRAAGNIVSIDETLNTALEELRYIMESGGGPLGLTTRFTDLDRYTGGLCKGEFIVLAARTSVGKTTMALNIALDVMVNHEAPVLIFSLEMGRHQLARNLLSMYSKVSFHKLKAGQFITEAEWETVEQAAKVMRTMPLYIDDGGGLTISQLRARARRYHQRHGIKLIIVDYLQLVQSPHGRRENRQIEVTDVSQGMKSLAKELNIPVLVLAQLRRDAEEQPPQLSHLRESGSIEQDADKVILIHGSTTKQDETSDSDLDYGTTHRSKHEEDQRPDVLSLRVAKNRSGPTSGPIKLNFFKHILRFEAYSDLDANA